jgi:hypothetical protein
MRAIALVAKRKRYRRLDTSTQSEYTKRELSSKKSSEVNGEYSVSQILPFRPNLKFRPYRMERTCEANTAAKSCAQKRHQISGIYLRTRRVKI